MSKKSKIKVEIDKNLCIGCGACTAIAPQTFQLDSNQGKAKVVKQPKKIDETIKMAANSCPVGAIKIR